MPWLMKSEPDHFSILDLQALPKQTDCWDGIRNYQARNYMRDDMQVGEQVLFYHSSCKVPGVAGLAEVASKAYPDHTAWDPTSKYFDPKSSRENPTWMMVDLRLISIFSRIISLSELREWPALQGMVLLKKGMRLSIQPVTDAEFNCIVKYAAEYATE